MVSSWLKLPLILVVTRLGDKTLLTCFFELERSARSGLSEIYEVWTVGDRRGLDCRLKWKAAPSSVLEWRPRLSVFMLGCEMGNRLTRTLCFHEMKSPYFLVECDSLKCRGAISLCASFFVLFFCCCFCFVFQCEECFSKSWLPLYLKYVFWTAEVWTG